MIIEKLKKAPIVLKPNYCLIPVNCFPFTEEGVEAFNEVYFYLEEYYCKEFHTIVRTPSNGISITKENLRLPCWDVRNLSSMVELTVLSVDGMFRVQLRTKVIDNSKESADISGTTAFKEFVKICKKHEVNLNDFAVDNGKEYNDQIVNPPKKLWRPAIADMVFEHVHHLDLNSSFMAGIAKAFPKFEKPIQEIYKKRKNNDGTSNDFYKAILTHTYGYMRSSYKNYKWAHMSKAGIDYNNKRLEELTQALLENGFIILSYNTDGIWYTHPEGKVYHDNNEGKELGQWKNDHFDCKFQAHSCAAYHFIENGKCTTVLSGITRLDRIKPRDEWAWEDLYNKEAKVAKIIFERNKGARFIYE